MAGGPVRRRGGGSDDQPAAGGSSRAEKRARKTRPGEDQAAFAFKAFGGFVGVVVVAGLLAAWSERRRSLQAQLPLDDFASANEPTSSAAGADTSTSPAAGGDDALSDEEEEQYKAAEELRMKIQYKASVAQAMQAVIDLMMELSNQGRLHGEELRNVTREVARLKEAIKDVADLPARRNLEATLQVIEGNLPVGDAAPKYKDPQYWEEYYKGAAPEERYEWLLGHGDAIPSVDLPPAWRRGGAGGEDEAAAGPPPATFGALLREMLGAPEAELLMIGCGHSDLSEHLHRDGFTRITNIDISGHVVENMRSQLEEKLPGMRWLQMNASNMEFEAGSFDAVVDKSTVDAVMEDRFLALGVLTEVHRVLRPGGVFLMASLFEPQKNLVWLTKDAVGWKDCINLKLSTSTGVFFYACERASSS